MGYKAQAQDLAERRFAFEQTQRAFSDAMNTARFENMLERQQQSDTERQRSIVQQQADRAESLRRYEESKATSEQRYQEGRATNEARYQQARADRAEELWQRKRDREDALAEREQSATDARSLRGASALLNEEEIDKRAALISAQYLPDTAKIKFDGAPSKASAVATAFGDDPRSELPQLIKDNYRALLSDRKLTAQYEPGELLQRATEMAMLAKNKDGLSIWERANYSDAQRQASFMPGFMQGPAPKPLPGFDEYRTSKLAELPQPGEHSDLTGDVVKGVGLGLAGAAGAGAAAAAGISASVALGLGALGVAGYTAVDRAMKGTLTNGDHPVRDFALDFLGNAGAVAMGIVPGGAAGKAFMAAGKTGAIGLGTAAEIAAPAFNRTVLSIAGGELGTDALEYGYNNTEYAKLNQGTTKDLLIRLGLGIAGWTVGEKAGGKLTGLVDKLAPAGKLSEHATALLARDPSAENIVKAAAAQDSFRRVRFGTASSAEADGAGIAFDVLKAAENRAGGKPFNPEDFNNPQMAERLNRYMGLKEEAAPQGVYEGWPIAQPGGRALRELPPGEATPQPGGPTRGEPATPGEGAIAQPGRAERPALEGSSQNGTGTPAPYENRLPAVRPASDVAVNLRMSPPGQSEASVRKAFVEASPETTDAALELSTKKGVPIVEAAKTAMHDTKLADEAATTTVNAYSRPDAPAANPRASNDAIARLREAGYSDADVAAVAPVVRAMIKQTPPSNEFLRALRRTALNEEGVMQTVTKKTYNAAMDEFVEAQRVAPSELTKRLDSLSGQRPDFPHGADESTMAAYRERLTSDFQYALDERDKLVGMIRERTPGLKNASDEAILSTFEQHPAGKAFNSVMKQASDEALTRAMEELAPEAKDVLASVGAQSKEFMLETTRLNQAADKLVPPSLADRVAVAKEQAGSMLQTDLPWKIALLLGSSGLAALGTVTFGDNEAEAGMLSSFIDGTKAVMPKFLGESVKAASPEATGRLVKEALAEHWMGVPANPETGNKGSWMRQISQAGRAVEAFSGDPAAALNKAMTGGARLPLGFDRMMTVGGLGRLHYGEFDPSVQIASMQTAAQFNTQQVYGPRLQAIFDAVGAKSVSKELAAETNPIVQEFGWTERAMSTAQLAKDRVEKVIEPLLKKAAERDASDPIHEALAKAQEKLDQANRTLEAVGPIHKDYLNRMDEVFARHASNPNNPSVRMALALDDTADFAKRPWMQGKLSSQEERAVNMVRDILNEYGSRLTDQGERVISRPYLPYIASPETISAVRDKATQFLLDKAPILADSTPYSKMYSRELFSSAKVPDVVSSMMQYVQDTERRLGWMQFWDKGNKGGWYEHSRSAYVKNNPGAALYWDKVKEMAKPEELTAANKWADRYTQFEVARLLSFAPSVGAKHLAKMLGQASQMGLVQTFKSIDDAARMGVQQLFNRRMVNSTLEQLGALPADAPELQRTAVQSLIMQGRHQNIMDNMGLLNSREAVGFDKWLGNIAQKGGVFIQGAEAIDRVNTILAGIDMAGKRGMTTQQALAGVYSSIMQNNFLGGALNAPWMKNPIIRSVAMFQSTPFKALERRLGNVIETAAGIKDAWSAIKTLSNADGLAARIGKNGIAELRSLTPSAALDQLLGLRNYITQGEAAFKENLIAEALFKRKDILGNSYTVQSLRDMLYTSAIIGGGSAVLGTNFADYAAHIPFVHLGTGDTQVGLQTSPLVKGMVKTWHDTYVKGNDFSTSLFLNNYLGKQGVFPTFVHKTMRLRDNDIPDMYNNSWMRYMFSVPAAGSHQ